MVSDNSRHSLAFTGMLVALAVSFGVSAAALGPPNPIATTELHKASPTLAAARQLNERMEALVKQHYPQLLQRRVNGTPVVNALFNDDGELEYSDYEIAASNPEGSLGNDYFAQHLPMAADEVAYIGLQAVVSGTTGQKVMVAFTQRLRPDEPRAPRVSLLAPPETRSIDRSLVERYFPDAFWGVLSDQARLWVLFDNNGNVLRTGTDFSRPTALTEVLEAEYPGIKTQFITDTPVTDMKLQNVKTSSGAPLQLFSVWLEQGSALP
jgi:hypothetical protein